jgi:hypothetical protein
MSRERLEFESGVAAPLITPSSSATVINAAKKRCASRNVLQFIDTPHGDVCDIT